MSKIVSTILILIGCNFSYVNNFKDSSNEGLTHLSLVKEKGVKLVTK